MDQYVYFNGFWCVFVCLERKEIRKRMMIGWRSVKA